VIAGPALDARILIVDDEPANVRLLERILEGAGYVQVQATTDSRQVEELFTRIEPDVVLLDLHMPYLDGLAVLNRIHDLLPPDAFVPVLVLTADTTSTAMRQALAGGATDFLVKPFDRTEVLLRIANLLTARRLHVDLELRNRDLEDQLRAQAEREAALAAERQIIQERIADVMGRGGLEMVYQPIAHLATGDVVGAEALARFSPEPRRTPDVWFAEAATVGLGTPLELAAVRAAVRRLHDLPPKAYLAVNVSPDTAQSAGLAEITRHLPAQRLVLELTEHAGIADYDELADALGPLRSAGVKLSVDDAGAGFASLRHILNLKPDIIKLDIGLIRGIDADPARRALTSALVGFAAEIDANIIAEGIETADELATLLHLGVTYGQGYHLARPGRLPLPDSLPLAAEDQPPWSAAVMTASFTAPGPP
jgi:EAL domain-containing protein (putative c-di-GMP-specific phosphodiesterase class I)/CheY-like chemotaxis protein